MEEWCLISSEGLQIVSTDKRKLWRDFRNAYSNKSRSNYFKQNHNRISRPTVSTGGQFSLNNTGVITGAGAGSQEHW